MEVRLLIADSKSIKYFVEFSWWGMDDEFCCYTYLLLIRQLVEEQLSDEKVCVAAKFYILNLEPSSSVLWLCLLCYQKV